MLRICATGLVKLTPMINFTNIYIWAHLRQYSCAKKALNVSTKKLCTKKGARKMLVKLTLDGLKKKVKLKLKKEFCVREVEKGFLQKRWRWISRKKSPFFHPLCFKTLKGNVVVVVVVVSMADYWIEKSMSFFIICKYIILFITVKPERTTTCL